MGVSAKILEDLVLAKIIGLLQTVIAPDTTSERILCKALKTLPESTILSLASIATKQIQEWNALIYTGADLSLLDGR